MKTTANATEGQKKTLATAATTADVRERSQSSTELRPQREESGARDSTQSALFSFATCFGALFFQMLRAWMATAVTARAQKACRAMTDIVNH